MPEEKQLYMATEFFGYMIQILPILFLFFLPYRQEHLRADKRKLLAGLTIVTTAVSAGAVGFLGSIYNTPAYDMARTYGNMIFGGYLLLGNAMENALEACGREGVEEPFINLKIKQYKAALLIQIENRCPESGYPVMEEGKTPSTKRGRNHGYGISSMGAIAEKYQGSLEFWKKGSVFTLRIVLNIPEEPELQADRKKDGYGGE